MIFLYEVTIHVPKISSANNVIAALALRSSPQPRDKGVAAAADLRIEKQHDNENDMNGVILVWKMIIVDDFLKLIIVDFRI